MVPMVKPADEAQSEEEPSKLKVSSFLVAITLYANRKMATTWPYSLLSTFANRHFTCHGCPILR